MKILIIPIGKVACITEDSFVILKGFTFTLITPEMEDRMRTIANLIIDRILENK